MFPNGLPEALGASVAQQASSEAASSDSENGGMQLFRGDRPFFPLAMLIKPQDASASREGPATAAPHERPLQDLGRAPPVPRALVHGERL